MKYAVLFTLSLFVLFGCNTPQATEEIVEENWSKRKADITQNDSLIDGRSYLSLYSQMYSFTQHRKINLTGIVNISNVSDTDTIYLTKADYFNTHGDKLRTYFDFPVYVRPMETLVIVIDHTDIEGGTGSNFVLDWKTPKNCPDPLFEGLMNYMQGNLGVAFTTQAKRIR